MEAVSVLPVIVRTVNGHSDKQNTCFLVALEGLYPCPDLVERVLAPRTGEVIEIIDLGEIAYFMLESITEYDLR